MGNGQICIHYIDFDHLFPGKVLFCKAMLDLGASDVEFQFS